MKKILFITSRNVLKTSGELRLIKNRAATLKEKYNITTDFLVLRKDNDTGKVESLGETMLVKTFLYNKKNPISIREKRDELIKEAKKMLSTNEYSTVVFSGGLIPAKIAKEIKKTFPNLYYVIDFHGADEELLEFSGGSAKRKLIRKTTYKWIVSNKKKYVCSADGVFAVSNALREYAKEYYNLTDKDYYIIPCANSDSKIDAEKQLNARKEYREHYGIKDNETAFIYSGGVSAWQCIDESVELFKKIKEQEPNLKAKLLVFSSNLDAIKKYESDGVIIDSIHAEKIDEVLCAGDVAFMLRGDYITNHVAYPNKFLEYVRSGMYIIATPFVYDVAQQLKEYSLGSVISLENVDINALVNEIASRKSYGTDFPEREKLIEDKGFEKTLEPFVNKLKEIG